MRYLGARRSWGDDRAIPDTSRGRAVGGGAPHGLDVQRVEHREAR